MNVFLFIGERLSRTISVHQSKKVGGKSLAGSASIPQDPSGLRYCPSIAFSSWLTTFQMSVLVWRGMLGSLLISSSIEIAYAARTVSESSRLSSRVLASSAARRMFLGTESSPTMRTRISMLCFKMPSLSDNRITPRSIRPLRAAGIVTQLSDDPHNI